MTGLRRPVAIGAVAVVVVMVLAWWFLLWSPRSRSYNDANTAAQQAEGQVQQLRAQVSRLESIKQQIPQLQAELAKLQAAVPDKPLLDEIILGINGAALQSGVQLMSIAPTPPAATSPTGGPGGAAGVPPSIRISLSLKGGYDQVLDFMNRLNGLPRLLVIDTVGLTGNAPSPANTSAGAGEPAATTTSTTLPAELTISMTVRLFVTTAPPTAGATTTTTTPAAGTATTTTTAPGNTATTSTTAPTTATTTGASGG